jgi:hypothetical protein
MAPSLTWLQSLRRVAFELCQTVAIIKGPPDIRPWNTSQIIWAGQRAPDPHDPVFAYHHLGQDSPYVAILGTESRACLSEFEEIFAQDPLYAGSYGMTFLRDMLVGLLQMSLPDAPDSPVPSPYWKRYVAPAVAQLRAGSPERYAEAVETALRALPAPHAPTLVVLPLAGVHTLGTATLAGVTMLPEAICTSDPDLAHCGMFLHRLRDLQALADRVPVVFAKVTVPAEPGLAVERAVQRAEQLCRLLRLLPNPGLADRPLADPPRIDLDASDSAAFYIAETSIGTHPIPVRRTTSEPQGRIANWRVEPRLQGMPWRRLAQLIERGPTCDMEARLLTGLRYLGEAVAEPRAASAIVGALHAVEAMLGAPELGERPADLAAAVGGLAGGDSNRRALLQAQHEELALLAWQLMHDLDQAVSAQSRADAVWLAFGVLEGLLGHEEVQGYRDLKVLLGK